MIRTPSTGIAGRRPTAERTPWLWFLFLTGILMVCQHNFSLREVLADDADADSYIAVYQSGDVHRKVGFPLLGLAGLFLIWKTRHRPLNWRSLIVLLVALLWIWACSSFFWSIDPPMTIRRALVLTSFLLGTLGFAAQWSKQQAVNWIVFCGSSLLAWGVVREIFLGRFALGDPIYRFSGTTHTNQQGQLCAVLAVAALAGARLNPRHRLLFLSASMFGLVFLLMTKSRTSFAGFLAALSVYLYLVLPRAKKFRLVFLAVMLLLIAALLAGEVGLGVFQDFLMLGRSDETVSSLTGRIPLWGVCLQYVQAHPFAGYGYAAFWTPNHIDDISYASEWNIHEAHSAYVDLLLDLGAFGLLLHTGLLITAMFRSIRYFRATGDAFYAFVAGLVVGWFVLGSLESSMLTKDSTPAVFLLLMIMVVGLKPPRKVAGRCVE